MDCIWLLGFRTFVACKHPSLALLRKLKTSPLFRRPCRARYVAAGVAGKPIPKKIWMYWAQGWDNAPELALVCRRSWEQMNPGWEVVALSKDSLHPYFMPSAVLETRDIPHAAYSDIVRVGLLLRHGGVWADATTFCAAPLDGWLPAAAQNGFFAFEKKKTTLASWCIAASPGHELVAAWSAYVDRYWSIVRSADWYFWLHYLFEYLLFLNAGARRLWRGVPVISADPSYAVQTCFRRGGSAAECFGIVSGGVAPVYKLDWKTPFFSEEFLRLLKSRLWYAVS